MPLWPGDTELISIKNMLQELNLGKYMEGVGRMGYFKAKTVSALCSNRNLFFKGMKARGETFLSPFHLLHKEIVDKIEKKQKYI